ncbi:MAG: HAD family hydrolase [Caldiserica bacterium]|nr:HAD family hydrolase [Caldisericota bacterium]
MEINVISFDIDGTLVEQKFNDIIWEYEIPMQVAESKGWALEEAKNYCKDEYRKLGDKDLRWYDIEYWLKRFGIKTPAIDILRKWEKSIKVYPDVFPTLKRLAEDGLRLIVITCMPRIFLKEKIYKFDSFFERVFSTISDFKKVKAPEVYRHIAQEILAEPASILHVGDHPVLDYEFSRQAGYKSLLIERNGKTRPESIQNLEEIFPCL